MQQNLERVLSRWRFYRSQTLDFLEILTHDEICYKLPRPGLDTFGKHFLEMAEVQKAYTEALETGKIDFSVGNYDQPSIYGSKSKLRAHFKRMDDYMVRILKQINEVNREIDWGLEKENPNVLEHLEFLIQHEILHHGQLVSFAYLFSLPIPESIVNTWAFPLNETQEKNLKNRATGER
jgi:uncharacterized damage-inducible protein DinB